MLGVQELGVDLVGGQVALAHYEDLSRLVSKQNAFWTNRQKFKEVQLNKDKDNEVKGRKERDGSKRVK